MSKEFQEFPDQRRERDVHDKKGDGEFLSDEPGEDYLFTHVMEQIRKQSAVPGAAKIIENPLKQAERTSFSVDGTANGPPSTQIIRRLRRRLQREGFATRNHPDFPSYFEVRWT